MVGPGLPTIKRGKACIVAMALALAGCGQDAGGLGDGGGIDAAPDGGEDGGLLARCSPDLSAPENGSIDRARGVAGDVATYACDDGYVLTGNGDSSTRTCGASGVWSGSAPTCEPVSGPCTPNPCLNGGRCTIDTSAFVCDCAGTGYGGATCTTPIACDGATAPAHGTVSSSAASYPNVVTYACDLGYTLVGSSYSRCTADGTFNPGPPACEPNPCAPDLTPPANGSVDRTSGVTGDVATYACDPGYALSGSATRTCEMDGAWSGSLPSCQPNPCSPDLTLPANGSVDRTSGVTDDVATYSCDAGYARSGSATRTCQTDGTWSGTAPACEPNPCAPDLTPPANGSVDRTSGATGDLATYSCDAGYALGGNSTRTCQADGAWSGTAPSCTPNPCSADLTPPANGSVDRTSGATGDVATYSCNADYVLMGAGTRACQASGLWSGAAPICSPGEWSWENPLPQGNSLYGVWGSSTSDVWAVGNVGTIVHWNGSAWSSVSSGTAAWLLGVWGSSASDVWAVGRDGTILHWNGNVWSSVSSGTTSDLYRVWGNSASDVWAVGDIGTIIHWNGVAWSSVSSGTTNYLNGVWGSSASDVWAVGGWGTILRWNGSAWSIMSSGTTSSLRGVWGSSASDVWAVGGSGTILHWNGGAWSSL